MFTIYVRFFTVRFAVGETCNSDWFEPYLVQISEFTAFIFQSKYHFKVMKILFNQYSEFLSDWTVAKGLKNLLFLLTDKINTLMRYILVIHIYLINCEKFGKVKIL